MVDVKETLGVPRGMVTAMHTLEAVSLKHLESKADAWIAPVLRLNVGRHRPRGARPHRCLAGRLRRSRFVSGSDGGILS